MTGHKPVKKKRKVLKKKKKVKNLTVVADRPELEVIRKFRRRKGN